MVFAVQVDQEVETRREDRQAHRVLLEERHERNLIREVHDAKMCRHVRILVLLIELRELVHSERSVQLRVVRVERSVPELVHRLVRPPCVQVAFAHRSVVRASVRAEALHDGRLGTGEVAEIAAVVEIVCCHNVAPMICEFSYILRHLFPARFLPIHRVLVSTDYKFIINARQK